MSKARFTPEEHAARRAWIAELPPRLAELYDGVLQNIGQPPKPLIERILTNIAIDDNGCWLWTLKIDQHGYGATTVGGGPHRHQHVHRVTYILFVGDIDDDLTIDHLCRVRACCNPDHLEPVTIQVNLLRGEAPPALNARKTHCKNGHLLEGANVKVEATGFRRCQICARDYRRQWNKTRVRDRRKRV
jgi:hypothetical protein